MTAMPPTGQGPPPPPEPSTLRPSRVWYIVATVVAVLALAGAGTLIGLGVTSFPNPSTTVPASGESKRVQLDNPGLTVFIDRTGVSGRCDIRDQDGGNVALAPIKGNESISINGDHWYVVLRTPGEVPAGTYTVSCQAAEPDAQVAVGPHQSVLGSVGKVLGGVGIAFFGVVAAFVVWLVTFLRRRSARRRAQQVPPYGFPPQYPGGPQQYPGGPPPPAG